MWYNSYFKRGIILITGSDGNESAIIRNMAKLASGDGIAKALGILSMPIITRIYLPEHLGVLAVFTAIVAIIAPIGTLRYSLAIPLPKSDGMAMNITILSLTILTVTSILTVLVFFFWGKYLLEYLSMDQLIQYWYLIPIAIIGSGTYEILSNWAVREKVFYHLAKTKVWQQSIGTVSKIGLGLLGLKPLGLLIGHIFTQGGGILTLLKVFTQKFNFNLLYVTRSRSTFAAKRYANFPKYRMPSQVLLLFSSKIILFYFAWNYGANIAGLIGLALMMVMLPITLFGYTTGKAYYAEIAKMGKEKRLEILTLTKNIVKKLFVVGLLPFFILFFFGPWLFGFAFGGEWNDAGLYASILSIYLLVQFVYSPISEGVFNVFEKQSLVLGIEFVRLIITIIAFSVSYLMKWNPSETLILYSIFITIHYSFAIYIVLLVINNYNKKEINIYE